MILASGLITSSAANALTADDVMNKMTKDQQNGYFAGVIEGLAQARWIADKPDATGMTCIHDWFYGGGSDKWALIEDWYNRNLDKPAAALMYVLVKRECGG